MLSRFSRRVWATVWVLAILAGIINVVGLLGFQHETITHLTGNTSRLAEALAGRDLGATLHWGALLAAFVVGTAISGFLIRDRPLELDANYGIVLVLESVLLFAAVPLLDRQSSWGLYAIACACGLQNAMITTYSGAVVRTTHVSGMFTDLGIGLGRRLRGLAVDPRRLRLCAVVISGFLIGGMAGTLAFRRVESRALLIPAAATLAIAAGYEIMRRRAAPR